MHDGSVPTSVFMGVGPREWTRLIGERAIAARREDMDMIRANDHAQRQMRAAEIDIIERYEAAYGPSQPSNDRHLYGLNNSLFTREIMASSLPPPNAHQRLHINEFHVDTIGVRDSLTVQSIAYWFICR